MASPAPIVETTPSQVSADKIDLKSLFLHPVHILCRPGGRDNYPGVQLVMEQPAVLIPQA